MLQKTKFCRGVVFVTGTDETEYLLHRIAQSSSQVPGHGGSGWVQGGFAAELRSRGVLVFGPSAFANTHRYAPAFLSLQPYG